MCDATIWSVTFGHKWRHWLLVWQVIEMTSHQNDRSLKWQAIEWTCKCTTNWISSNVGLMSCQRQVIFYTNSPNNLLYAKFHWKSESAIRIALAHLETNVWTFKVKWAEQVMVKFIWPNWIFHSFIGTLSSLGPVPVRSHLQGGFHPVHNIPSPGSEAGWELAHPA